MKYPTSNGKNLDQIGNDYPQTPSAYFVTSSYRDGIYTELKSDFNPVTAADLSGDVFFDLKDAKGINKRVLDVLPQDDWAEVSGAFSGDAFLSDDYATGEFKDKPAE